MKKKMIDMPFVEETLFKMYMISRDLIDFKLSRYSSGVLRKERINLVGDLVRYTNNQLDMAEVREYLESLNDNAGISGVFLTLIKYGAVYDTSEYEPNPYAIDAEKDREDFEQWKKENNEWNQRHHHNSW